MRQRAALQGLKRTALDVTCSLRCRVRAYRSRNGSHVIENFRVVAIYNDEKRPCQLYVTNVPITVLTAELVARTYRLRWEVEQFFKTGKSGSGLMELPSRNEIIVLTFIYAALCRATLSMRGRRRARAILRGRSSARLNGPTWHRLWLQSARAQLRHLLGPPAGLTNDDLLRLLGDPNTGRWNTLGSFAEDV